MGGVGGGFFFGLPCFFSRFLFHRFSAKKSAPNLAKVDPPTHPNTTSYFHSFSLKTMLVIKHNLLYAY